MIASEESHGDDGASANAYDRFERWFAWLDVTQTELAKRLDCTPSAVSHIIARRRSAGIELAAAIEAQSADWPDGPIFAVEWAARS